MTVSNIATIPDIPGHVLLYALEAWGHVRPLCVLGARIARTQRVRVTIFTPEGYKDQIYTELARNIEDECLELIQIHVVPSNRGNGLNALDMKTLSNSFTAAYEELIRTDPPDAMIIDAFCNDVFKVIRLKSKKPVKIYLWYPAAATVFASMCSPKEIGGRGDPRPDIYAEVSKSGRDIKEVAQEIVLNLPGELLCPPGMHPMYDHELFPQVLDPHMLSNLSYLWLAVYESIDLCDGLIFFTSEEYEPAAIATVKSWLAKPVYTVGPLLPSPQERSNVGGENGLTKDTRKIKNFMDGILNSYGIDSMIYISFGSLIWPTEPEKLWTVLDVIMAKRIPFIMSLGAPSATIPDEIVDKVKKYDLGMFAPWTPQQAILSHPATGWFISHCGQNGTFEAISAGVPMICWPYLGDQPFNAIHLTCNFDVAYELFEVRGGEWGSKVIYRTGTTPEGTLEAVRKEISRVLDEAFEVGGQYKRINMCKLQKTMSTCWKDGGSSKMNFDELVETFIPRTGSK
ncbi:Plant UDP-glycosyltransferase [Abortiporus biennis]